MDKQRIAATFAGAASDYDAYAVVQRHAAQQLAQQVQAQWPELRQVLEIGCGTGNLSELMLRAYPDLALLATDIAPEMVQACRSRLLKMGAKGVRYAVVDGEYCAADQADLVLSSLVFQWFDDQEAALRRLGLEAPRMAVATLLAGTFGEWRAAHTRLGLDDGVRHFMTEERLHLLCAQIGARCHVETVVEHFPDVLQFVRALKAIGAGTARLGHRPTPLRRVLRAFPAGIDVSYCVAYIFAGKGV